jgi:tetratricopeptide (TPR) repeat protein
VHSNCKKSNPTVFITYAHEGDLGERVAALAEWLTDNGVQVITDHPYKNRPPEIGWRAWMQHSIEDADMVLIVCSERYKRLFEKRETIDGGGFGVTWESAIINDDLYQSRLRNQRFYPILPDDGDHSHIPRVLNEWYNNHRFPSGNSGILSLIRDEIKIPKPKQPMQQLLPGELSGSNDPRLQPREGEVVGREDKLAEVIAFLTGSNRNVTVCGHITGSAGIGKTEVCKEALKRWLDSGSSTRAFWVQVSNDADTRRLLGHLGDAVGLSPDTIAQLSEFSQLRQHLPGGLYYLDNLESVAESFGGKQLLRELSQVPGIRLLASSRVTLSGVLGSSIAIGPLDTDSAVNLFLKCWTGSSTPNKTEVKEFVYQQLGGHALSITLLARLGRAYSWQTLRQIWYEQGTNLAKSRKAGDRLDSLEISFALAVKLLAEEPSALALWQFAALFPDGFDEETLSLWEKISGHSQARVAMADHHLLSINEDRITMLPPIARYALDHTASVASAEYSFNWDSARNDAYNYFIVLSRNASNIISNDINIHSRLKSSQQLWAIEQLFKTDLAFGSPNEKLIQQLHQQLHNVYSFNVMAGQAILKRVNHMFGDALSERLLGDLESRLGNVDQARGHYDHAIELYQKEQAKLGLANALKALGDLESRLGNVDQARGHYDHAIELYQKEQAKLGLANALKALGDLESRLGNVDQARGHYDHAIELYQKEQAKLGLANALKALGDLERRLGNVDQARGHYDHAIELYQKEQAKLGLANALKALGDLERRLGNVDQARGHYDHAIELYQKEQDQLGLANALKALGDLERRLGNVDQARGHYDHAIELYQKEQDQLGLANALKALGDLESRLGNVDQARGHYDHAIELYQKEQAKLGLANALQALGDLERRLGNVDQARGHYDHAIELYQKEQDQLGLANALKALGDLERRLGNVDQARGHYDHAIELYQKEQAKLGLANALKALGDLERRLGNVDQARGHYDHAIELYQKEQDQLGLANALKALGDLERRLGNVDQARGHYDHAIELYQKEQAKLGLANALKALGDLERRLGNVDQARGHYDHAIELYQKEQDQLGLANALQSLGDLLLSADRTEEALPFYQDAISLYQSEQEPMGLAYSLAEIVRCCYRLGSLDRDELEKLAAKALTMAGRSGVESVSQYVMGALYEACDEDKDKIEDLLKTISVED